MNDVKMADSKWQITLKDSITGKIIDSKKYFIKGEKRDEMLEGIGNELKDQFEKVGLDPDTIKIEMKFLKYVRS